MENPEGVLNLLDEFAKMKSKEIPNDLEEYLLYVAASGDPVYQWPLIKSLYRQKLINVITEFYETCPMMGIPPCPNVDPFNYETMKNSLLERLDSFASAPFTIQRISELLTTPRKQYNRVDKFMRAIEKNIWVVSTREPGQREQASGQEASGNLVNGVAPSVRVTVKHPKRGKSIEERIKSGHPQLIDDDEEEENDDSIEGKSNQELLANNDAEESALQCTSVKDLIEKYENGTIFCSAEEKTVHLEESAVSNEASPASVSVSRESTDLDHNSEQESDDEEVNIDKLVSSDECSKTESIHSSEVDKLESSEDKNTSSQNEIPISVVDVKQSSDAIPCENSPPESSGYGNDRAKPDTTEEIDRGVKSNVDAEAVTVMEVLGLGNVMESNGSENLLNEPDSEDSANVAESPDDKEAREMNEAEVKNLTSNEAEAAVENQESCYGSEEKNIQGAADEISEADCKLDCNTNVVLGLEADSSSADDAGVGVPILSDALDFIEEKDPSAEKVKGFDEEDATECGKSPETSGDKCFASSDDGCSTTTFDPFDKAKEFDRIKAELCFQTTDLLEAKMEEGDSEDKSNEMMVEESDKIEEMEVDEANTNSPMVEEDAMEPMDEDTGCS